MLEELEKWMCENHIDFKWIEDGVLLEITGAGKFFVLDTGGEVVLDEEFSLNLNAMETDRDELLDEEIMYTIYKFGEIFYYTSNKEEVAEMNKFVAVGEAFLEMEEDYTHLAVHGHRELLNGSGQYEDYAKKAKFYGYKAIGLAEKNTLAGALLFQNACSKYGVKPILGMTIDVATPKGKREAKVYAKNGQGWKNLLNIANIISNVNFVEKVVSESELIKFGEGVDFVFSKDWVPNKVELGQYSSNFDHVYYQLDTTEYAYEAIDINYLESTREYIDLYGSGNDLQPILISDSYYADQCDHMVKKTLNLIGVGASYLQSKEQYFKPIENHFDKMDNLFTDEDKEFFEEIFFDAVTNTMKVAVQTDFSINTDFLNMPEYELTEEETISWGDKYGLFQSIVDDNWDDRVPEGMDDEYQERLDEEFRVIDDNGFLDYFLINWDWITKCCKANNIYTGVGRGSAGGSVLSYLLGVTNIDPIKYELLFERFLNEGRLKKTVKTKYTNIVLFNEKSFRFKSDKLVDCGDGQYMFAHELKHGMGFGGDRVFNSGSDIQEETAIGSPPDIDSDVESSGRQQVKEYLEGRYGKNRVFSIGTFTSLGIKSAISDVARKKGVSTPLVKTVTKMVTQKEIAAGFTYTDFFIKAQKNPVVKKFIVEYPEVMELVRSVMGNSKATSVHAAGVVITPKYDSEGNEMNAWDWVPVKNHDGQMISEWEGGHIEQAGMLKLDLLGTTILDKIHVVIDSIYKVEGKKIDFYDIYTNRLEDQKAFDVFTDGFTQNVFQFSGGKMTKFIQSMEPTTIEDIFSANALYRPATMNLGYHEDYVEMKHGRKEPVYDWGLEEITKSTYGIMCLSGDSNITTQNGIKKINEVSIGDMVVTETGEWKEVENVLDQGIKRTFRLRTSFGEELVATADHKILTQRGWVEMQNLDIKRDIIKGHWMYPESKNGFGTISDWCVGLALADGYFGKGTPQIACSSEDFANKVKAIFDDEFNLDCKVYFSFRTWYCSLSAGRTNRDVNGSYSTNNFTNLLKSLGLYGKTKGDKFFPKNSTLMTAIGFIEGDGCLETGSINLGYSSMADGVFRVLQENRVHSSRHDGVAFHTKFDCGDERLKFLIKENLAKRTNNKSVVPRQYLLDQKHKLSGYHKKNHTSSAIRRDSRFVSATICNNFDIDIEHDTWGVVLSIKEDVVQRVYDLSIRDIHSFTSGGLVVHNCYQEQMMQAVQKIGGFSLQEADAVRKAMGKKNQELMDSYKNKFVDGGVSNGCDELEALKIWNKIEQGASYGFNRSHAAAYGLESYVTAYLKAHYPVHFYTMSLEFSNDDDRPLIISEINDDGRITIAAPNVNTSSDTFVTDFPNKKIYWALSSIKFVGDVATRNIVSIREDGGKYLSMLDFLNRTKGKKVNKKTVENLILSGAFDEIESISSVIGRYKLIVFFYSQWLNESVPEEKYPKDQVLKPFFWNMLQNQLSGLGNIDYRSVYSSSGFKEKFKKLSYLSPDDFNKESKDGKYVGFAAVLADITLLEAKKSGDKFGKILLQCNDKLFSCMVWKDQWDEWQEALTKAKGRIIVFNAKVNEDAYSGGNQLCTHGKTVFKILS